MNKIISRLKKQAEDDVTNESAVDAQVHRFLMDDDKWFKMTDEMNKTANEVAEKFISEFADFEADNYTNSYDGLDKETIRKGIYDALKNKANEYLKN